MFTIEMAKQRHCSESSSSDGFVTRSKHKIYNASWKTDCQWYIPVYDSSVSTVVGLFGSNMAQIRETAQGHGQINRAHYEGQPQSW